MRLRQYVSELRKLAEDALSEMADFVVIAVDVGVNMVEGAELFLKDPYNKLLVVYSILLVLVALTF